MSDLFSSTFGESSSEPSAPTETASAPVENNEPDIESAIESHFTTASTTTETPKATEPTAPTAEQAETDAELTDEEKELKELKEYAENPNTPAFARTQIERAIKFNESLKNQYAEKETQYQTELDTLKSSRAYEEQDLVRYKHAEERLNTLSSIAAKPDDVLNVLKEVNPRIVPQVQQQLIWSAIERPDGSPDLDNLQAIVDRFAGVDGEQVKAADVLSVISAMKEGRLDPLDLDDLSYDERQRVERTRALERQAEERQRVLDQEILATESRARQDFLTRQASTWQSQIKSQAETHLSKFNLLPSANDPQEAKEFKEGVKEQILLAIQRVESTSPYLKEITQAYQLLARPDEKRRMSSMQAEAEINAYFSNPLVQSKLQAAIAEVNQAVEKTVLRQARQYKLMMKGLEAMQKEKTTARNIPRTVGDIPNAQPVTAEQLQKMTAQERHNATLQAMSDAIRQANAGGSFG